MTRGVGVEIDGSAYNLVNDHETYVVTDVPSHPDSDGRMERRVVYDVFTGISQHKEAHAVDTQQITSNVYTRMIRNGDRIWWANGGDTRTVDRIFAQRASTAINPSIGTDWWRFFLDGNVGTSILVSDTKLYSATFNANTGAQTAVLASDLTTIWGTGASSTPYSGTVASSGSRKVSDCVLFNGRIFIGATRNASDSTQPLGLVNDFTNPQPYIVWDQSITPLEAPIPYVSPSAPTVSPEVVGTTTYNYFVVAIDPSGKTSAPSQIQQILTGPNQLDDSNRIRVATPAAFPAGMPGGSTFQVYRGATTLQSQQNMVGLVASGLDISMTFFDVGALPTVDYICTTPGFAVGDTGLASAFVVIRDTLWRAAGAKMWGWKATNGSWSATQHIGDPSAPITALDVFEDDLIIYKPDGLWTMDRGGNVFPLFPGVRLPGLNPRPLCQWRGMYYFAADFGMVWEYDGDKVTSIGFDKSEPFPMISGVSGIPNASTRGIPLPNFMLAGFVQANSSFDSGYVLAFDGTAWHPFQYDSIRMITALGAGGVSQIPAYPVLQMGWGHFSGSPGPQVTYLNKPTLDPALSPTFDAKPQVFYFPVDQGIVADEFKILESVRATVDNAIHGTIRFAYALDDDIQPLTFTDFGAPDGDKQLIQTFVQTDPLPQYRKHLLRCTLTANGDIDANTASISPIIRTVVVRYKQRQFQRRAWEMQLFLEEGQLTNHRTRDNRTSQQMLNALNAARESKKLVTFKDILGAEHQVYVESVGETIKAYRNRNLTVTFVCKVTLVEEAKLISAS